MESETNPTAARRELATIMREYREQRGYSLQELASRLGISAGQSSRLDTGARGFRVSDVRSLGELYSLPEPETARLLALAATSRKRAWWQQVELPGALRTLIGLEQNARAITEFNSTVFPGLMQTSAFARAAVEGGVDVDLSADEVDEAVAVRMRRQEILARSDAPELWAVVDEAALARVCGGPAVMRGQLAHLLDMTSRSGVTLQIIPFDYGAHPAGNSGFILVELDEGLADVVYVEGLFGRFDTSKSAVVSRYRHISQRLRAIALSPRQSRELMVQYADRYASMSSPDSRRDSTPEVTDEDVDAPP